MSFSLDCACVPVVVTVVAVRVLCSDPEAEEYRLVAIQLKDMSEVKPGDLAKHAIAVLDAGAGKADFLIYVVLRMEKRSAVVTLGPRANAEKSAKFDIVKKRLHLTCGAGCLSPTLLGAVTKDVPCTECGRKS